MNSSELIAAFAELYEDGYINQMTKKKVNATNNKILTDTLERRRNSKYLQAFINQQISWDPFNFVEVNMKEIAELLQMTVIVLLRGINKHTLTR